ncbi:MAG: heterodisulfide reductase-related iron-sulfur binding cluster [Phoenicibacter congonensis]|uniref:Heterodisulfide reductase-related iron-sulfur binding cluster n=1 Tax=Phoenicibacter congonensis TaxID=1944646 RepID=A0AA43RFZ8_9ACTN|nr:heterodisulfide reductase-related iron-sulfur binding cluster [Phoenicibacter congonensis]
MSFGTFMICLEKGHYPFKNYPKTQCKDVLFPGCAFPSQFPKTMEAIAKVCNEHDCGVAYDCCGHPLDGYGVEGGTDRVLRGIERRLAKIGCERVIVLCPNCWKLMKNRLNLPVISIYEYLSEIRFDFDANANSISGRMFVPCPDRQGHELEAAIRSCTPFEHLETMSKVPCCGLLPAIMAKGPEAVQKSTHKVMDAAGDETIYTYCASCLGQFSRMGNDNCAHVLSVLLGVSEIPDSKNAFGNRARCKFAGNTNPVA